MCVSTSQSEREEFETEYKQKYDRERILLTEENKKLASELDKVRYLFIYIYTHNETKFTMKTHTNLTQVRFLFLFCSFSIVVALFMCFSVLPSQLFSVMFISLNTHTCRKTQVPNPR